MPLLQSLFTPVLLVPILPNGEYAGRLHWEMDRRDYLDFFADTAPKPVVRGREL